MAEQFGGFQFQNQGFQFYKHPPAEAYGLNKLLFESRHSADAARPHHQRLRERSPTSTTCTGEQREAAEELINVGKGGMVSDHVGPLAEAGAHPLQALMSLHVIFSTTHKRGQQAMASAAGRNTDEQDCMALPASPGPAGRWGGIRPVRFP